MIYCKALANCRGLIFGVLNNVGDVMPVNTPLIPALVLVSNEDTKEWRL